MSSVELNSTSLYVEDEAPQSEAHCGPFLMVHGLARSGWFWKDWVPTLNREHRVVRVDLRGCGRNSEPAGEVAFTFEDLVSDVEALIDSLGLDHINYVGESTGGLVGTVVAARHPGLISTLNLVSTPTTVAGGDKSNHAPGAATPEDSLRDLGLYEWWMQSRAMTHDLFGDERDHEYATEFARTPVPVAVTMWHAMHQPDVNLSRWADQVGARTLILSPGRSVTLSGDGQDRLAEIIPGAVLRRYPEWTHGMYFLHAEELSAEVLDFVDDPERGGQS